jgi:hypothetical protein
MITPAPVMPARGDDRHAPQTKATQEIAGRLSFLQALEK